MRPPHTGHWPPTTDHRPLNTALTRALAIACVVIATACSRPSTRSPGDPGLFEVDAAAGWQGTGHQIDMGETFVLEFVAGEIRDRETTLHDAAGSDYICGAADCCEPMPHVRRSAVIARVGRQVFAVSNRVEVTAADSGELFLRVNDCDAGLYDNSGTATMRLVELSRP